MSSNPITAGTPFLRPISDHHHTKWKNQNNICTSHSMAFLMNQLDFCFEEHRRRSHYRHLRPCNFKWIKKTIFSLFAHKIFEEPNWAGSEFLFLIFSHLRHWPLHQICSGDCEFHPFLEWVSCVLKFMILCYVVEKNHVVLKSWFLFISQIMTWAWCGDNLTLLRQSVHESINFITIRAKCL